MSEISDEIESLADDAGALLDSTASTAAKRYDEARRALEGVLERGKDIYGMARKRAIKQTTAADEVLHENLYQTVLIGIGVGALLGFLLARQSASRRG